MTVDKVSVGEVRANGHVADALGLNEGAVIDDEVSVLALGPGTPVIAIVRTAYTADGTAVEVNEMTLDASAYMLRYEFDA